MPGPAPRIVFVPLRIIFRAPFPIKELHAGAAQHPADRRWRGDARGGINLPARCASVRYWIVIPKPGGIMGELTGPTALAWVADDAVEVFLAKSPGTR
jgi:hypothetical protein